MYIFIITWVCWFLSEIFLNRLFRSKIDKSKDMDKNSLRFIWITITMAISIGVYIVFNYYIPIIKVNYFGYIGLLVIIFGVIIRFIAVYTLGKYFTVDLAIDNNQKLIKKGFYKYVRHPSYTGSLLSFLGFGLSLNNWLSLTVIFIPVVIVFLYRINVEERLLLQQKDLEYKDYKNQTKRLIPFIY
jgi:protein-S-isoprenylcysteine O-methyltransferase Ste14